VAFAPYTPSHFLLWNGLKGSGLSTEQRNEIFAKAVHTKDGIEPATLFAQQKVDAAVAWDPDMSDAVTKRAGAKKIYDTRIANRLIADILVVSDRFAARNPHTVAKLAEGWLEGVEFIRAEDGRVLVYDVNTNTNYNAEAEQRAGRADTVEAQAGVVATADKVVYEPGDNIQLDAVVRNRDGQGADNAKVTALVDGPMGKAAPTAGKSVNKAFDLRSFLPPTLRAYFEQQRKPKLQELASSRNSSPTCSKPACRSPRRSTA